jgi:hypothetical protein
MKEAREEKPPILGTWLNIYLLLAGVLAVLGVAFYFFTKHFE